MMRAPSRARTGDIGFNMTPMIDVVFLLIIFFLVSSHLARQETQLDLPLPVADSGKEDVVSDVPRLTINVLGDGAMLVAGRSVNAEELRQQLQQRIERDGDRLQVRIRADRSVQYRHAAAVMLTCARAGVWNIVYAVYTQDQ